MKASIEAAAGRTVSRETLERLADYQHLLRSESGRQNLVSRGTLDDLWSRHIVDSAQLARYEPSSGATWLDVGSGAGLPGIVLACIVEGPVELVEPRKLRVEFLQTCVERLGLNARVLASKVERITGSYDIITGRAVAPLPRFLSMCDHLSTRKTVWALPKGRTAQSELAEARRSWQGDFRVEPSVTDAESKIIVGTQVRAGKR
ncbi:16S rRNA (guanine(527)-N(7))-methyltransferase RsmG [Sphingomonas limnosediminicola]|jgi:16S rRNA (guanine527-N7)-methyltransferase|uniref:16S rRNA (guanine(527)-N(7))-methyltransferase RsmG n=1 Tax=Sphingomonas limnosediminicola TaxID=940133 RepID=UPI0031CE5A44